MNNLMDSQRDQDGEEVTKMRRFVSGSALTMTLTTDKRRKRRSTPKSRNGCYRCKIRRVKCDETRPAPCGRCIKFGAICDGYPNDIKSHTQVLILPKGIRKYNMRFINMDPSFHGDNEGYYFDYYCSQTAARIGGPFPTNLWPEIVPHVSRECPSIRHTIIALGALTLARHDICQEHNFCDEGKILHSNKHHQFALQQYSKALQEMRHASFCSEKKSIRLLIISSLLVFCFECLLGHRSAAFAQASSIVSLISELLYRVDGKFTFSDPNPSVLDLELFITFSNLDLQALLFIDNRPLSMHQRLLAEMNRVIQDMPDHFSNLNICRILFYVIMRRNLHFIAVARAATAKTRLLKDSSDEVTTLCLGNNFWSNPAIETKGVNEVLLGERELCVRDVRQWESASATLIEEASIADEETFLVSSLFKIHAAMSIILLSRTFYPSEMATDEFLPEFKTIVDLSYSIRHLLIPTPSADNAAFFRFGIGILPALFQVGLLCRDGEIRGRAIDLLLKNPGYREAVWESDAVGQICNYVRRIEEAWCDGNGFIPGDQRATFLGVEFRGRSCKAEFMQRMGPGECDVALRSERFTW